MGNLNSHKSSSLGKVIKAYMVNEFTNKPTKVIIDSYGAIFAPGLGGWHSSYQSNDYYSFIRLPGEYDMYDSIGDLWAFWWERKAWDHPIWAWLNMK